MISVALSSEYDDFEIEHIPHAHQSGLILSHCLRSCSRVMSAGASATNELRYIYCTKFLMLVQIRSLESGLYRTSPQIGFSLWVLSSPIAYTSTTMYSSLLSIADCMISSAYSSNEKYSLLPENSRNIYSPRTFHKFAS